MPDSIYVLNNRCVGLVFKHWNGCESTIWYYESAGGVIYTLRYHGNLVNTPIFSPHVYRVFDSDANVVFQTVIM